MPEKQGSITIGIEHTLSLIRAHYERGKKAFDEKAEEIAKLMDAGDRPQLASFIRAQMGAESSFVPMDGGDEVTKGEKVSTSAKRDDSVMEESVYNVLAAMLNPPQDGSEGYYCPHCGDYIDDELKYWATRIENAIARDTIRLADGTLVLVRALDMKAHVARLDAEYVGYKNMAALYYALVAVKQKLSGWWKWLEVEKVVEEALAKPPRNCDLYSNTAKALGAYPDGPDFGEEWSDADWMAFCDWLFAMKEGAK